MNKLAGTRLRGRYVLASWLARCAGKDRWQQLRFNGQVTALLDLAVPKYWGIKFSPSPENGVQRFFACALRRGDMVYDVGANWGFYTLLAAALVGEKGAVTAFEPGTVSFQQIQEHTRRAGLWWVRPVHRAVTERGGERATFVIPRFGRLDTGAFLATGPTIHRKEQVQTLALDDYWQAEGSPRVRLLKIDVEGAEWSVLHGGEGLLRSGRCAYLVVETGIYAARYGRRARQTVEVLRGYGYEHLYRFIDEPPYLLPLSEKELDSLDANIAAAREPIDFLYALTRCPAPVLIEGFARASSPSPPQHDLARVN